MEFAYGPMFLVEAAEVEIVFVDAKHGPAERPKPSKLSLAKRGSAAHRPSLSSLRRQP